MLFHVDVCTFMLSLLSHTDPIVSPNCPHTEPCCPIMFPCCPQLPHCPALFPMLPTVLYLVLSLHSSIMHHAPCFSMLSSPHGSSCPYATPDSLTTIPIQCLHCLHSTPCCILSLVPCCPKICSILLPHCVPDIQPLISPPVPVLSSRLQHGLRGALGVGTCLPV